MKKLTKVILASSSPQKKKLMIYVANKLGLELVTENPLIEEIKDESPEKTAIANALLKLREVEGEFVVSSDAFASYKGELLFKPKDKEEAREILKKISGEEVSVYTATAVRIGKLEITDLTISLAVIKNFKEEEIEKKIQNPEILKKAGSFSISDIFLLKKGNLESIMGLNTSFVFSMYSTYIHDLEHI